MCRPWGGTSARSISYSRFGVPSSSGSFRNRELCCGVLCLHFDGAYRTPARAMLFGLARMLRLRTLHHRVDQSLLGAHEVLDASAGEVGNRQERKWSHHVYGASRRPHAGVYLMSSDVNKFLL